MLSQITLFDKGAYIKNMFLGFQKEIDLIVPLVREYERTRSAEHAVKVADALLETLKKRFPHMLK